MSEVSSEAVEAAALRMCRSPRWDASWDQGARDYWRDLARDALTAALPYLVAHQPARVAPSAEDIEQVIYKTLYESGASFESATVVPAVREAVLALFASQPTVAQVREQVARELQRFADCMDPAFGPLSPSERAAIRAAAGVIARAETKEGE